MALRCLFATHPRDCCTAAPGLLFKNITRSSISAVVPPLRRLRLLRLLLPFLLLLLPFLALLPLPLLLHLLLSLLLLWLRHLLLLLSVVRLLLLSRSDVVDSAVSFSAAAVAAPEPVKHL